MTGPTSYTGAPESSRPRRCWGSLSRHPHLRTLHMPRGRQSPWSSQRGGIAKYLQWSIPASSLPDRSCIGIAVGYPSEAPGKSSTYCGFLRITADAPVPRTANRSPRSVTAPRVTAPETVSGSGMALSHRASRSEKNPSLKLSGSFEGKDSTTASVMIRSMSWCQPEPPSIPGRPSARWTYAGASRSTRSRPTAVMAASVESCISTAPFTGSPPGSSTIWSCQ